MTDIRVSQAQATVVSGGTPALRVSGAWLQVVSPNIPSLPAYRWFCQWNPTDAAGGLAEWHSLYGAIPMTGADSRPALRVIEIDTAVARPTLHTDTARVTFRDPTRLTIPSNPDSPLYPGVREHLAVRIFHLDVDGIYYPDFYGRIKRFQPAQLQAAGYLEQTWELESPVAELLNIHVTPSFVPAGGWTWNSDAPTGSALYWLLRAIHDEHGDPIIAVANQDLPTGIYAPLAADWGNVEKTFGQYLEELNKVAGAYAWIQPVLKETGAGLNWQFRWRGAGAQLSAAATVTWNNHTTPCDALVPIFSAEPAL